MHTGIEVSSKDDSMGIVKMVEILEKTKKERGNGGRLDWTRTMEDCRSHPLGSYAGSCRCVNARTSSNAAPE